MIVERDKIKINFEKIKAIIEWKKSTHFKKSSSISKIRQFL
jgi:hypothetical protein